MGKGHDCSLGMKTDEIESIKSKQKMYEVANDNADGQVIVSGDIESVNSFKVYLKKKINQFHLKVTPFHCSLMKLAR